MASSAVRDAFKSLLEATYPGAYFDTLNVAPDFVPDESAGGSVPAVWYTLQFPSAAERRVSLGGPAACWRESGQAEVWATVASGTGETAARAAADALRDLLRAKQLTPAIRTQEADPPVSFKPDDGDYFSMVVAVPYVYEFYK